MGIIYSVCERKSSVFEIKTDLQRKLVLPEDAFKPAGEMLRGVEAGELSGGRVEHHVDGLTLGLTLHGGDGHIQIKNRKDPGLFCFFVQVSLCYLPGIPFPPGKPGGMFVPPPA